MLKRLIAEWMYRSCFIWKHRSVTTYFTALEKKKLIEKLSNNNLKDHFIIGTGENSLNQNIEIMKHSLKNGINRFLDNATSLLQIW